MTQMDDAQLRRSLELTAYRMQQVDRGVQMHPYGVIVAWSCLGTIGGEMDVVMVLNPEDQRLETCRYRDATAERLFIMAWAVTALVRMREGRV